MQQHEFNDEVINAIARQNGTITRAYNIITLAIVIGVINTLAIAAVVAWLVTR